MGEHRRGSGSKDVAADAAARLVLLAVLALVAVGTVISVVLLWPDDDDVSPSAEYSGEGVTFPSGELVEKGKPCPTIVFGDPGTGAEPAEDLPEGCNSLRVRMHEGPEQGEVVRVDGVPSPVAGSNLQPGDTVRLARIPPNEGLPLTYAFDGVVRNVPLGLMAALFVVVVALVARLRGMLAILGLVLAGVIIAKFMLPALLTGQPGIPVALAGSSLIMFAVLYLAHGLSMRTSTALAGTLAGIAIAGTLGHLAVGAARLSGISDDTGEMLTAHAPTLDYRSLLTAAIIIAGLGVLNDVTISQSSAVWELRRAAPQLPRTELFTSGMRIGRHHIASTIYTIVFAYAGAALASLMLISIYDLSAARLLSQEVIAEEIVRTLATAIGLVLAVPATTGIAALTVAAPTPLEDSEAID